MMNILNLNPFRRTHNIPFSFFNAYQITDFKNIHKTLFNRGVIYTNVS